MSILMSIALKELMFLFDAPIAASAV